MSKLSKKLKESTSKIDKNQLYTVDQASGLVKEISNLNFDASVDIAVKLAVNVNFRSLVINKIKKNKDKLYKDDRVIKFFNDLLLNKLNN